MTRLIFRDNFHPSRPVKYSKRQSTSGPTEKEICTKTLHFQVIVVTVVVTPVAVSWKPRLPQERLRRGRRAEGDHPGLSPWGDHNRDAVSVHHAETRARGHRLLLTLKRPHLTGVETEAGQAKPLLGSALGHQSLLPPSAVLHRNQVQGCGCLRSQLPAAPARAWMGAQAPPTHLDHKQREVPVGLGFLS